MTEPEPSTPEAPAASSAAASPANNADAPAATGGTESAAAASSPTSDAGADSAAAAGSPAGADSRTTDITAGQGGVMTDEVGVVTGDLTLRSELASGAVTVKVQYKDADEWYAVTGAKATLKDPADLDAVHAVAVGILNRPEG